MKKLFTLLTIAMVAMHVCAYDFSFTFYDKYNNGTTLYYVVNADGNTVTVVQGPETYHFGILTIPEKVENSKKTYTVTTIGAYAFSGSQIDSLYMANTITEIQSNAFEYSSLQVVSFSNNLKHIRGSAFFDNQYLRKVELHEGLETIGNGAFSVYFGSSSPLTQLTLPSTLKSIGEAAFANHRNLRTVDFSGAAVSIGSSAFASCQVLNNLEHTASLVSIGEYAFSGCASLQTVKIPDSFTEIANYAFTGCQSLTLVELSKNLIKIGDYAFEGCGLKTISFPPSLAEIGSAAFANCQFETMTLPDHITKVGPGAFRQNAKLTSFTFSKGMTTIHGTVENCEQLVTVNIPEGITSIKYGSFVNCKRLSTIKLPESLTDIEGCEFAGSGIQNINIPTGVSRITVGMFRNCEQLATITIPGTIKAIDEHAFEGCSNLRQVTLSEGLETIGYGAFSRTAIEEIVIPESVTAMGMYIFENCSELRKVRLPQALKEISGGMFAYCSKLKEVNIPEEVNIIGYMAFYGCSQLENISIPPYVESIIWHAFSYCSKLKNIVLPSSVNFLGWSAFSNCASLEEFHINRAIPPTVSNSMNEEPLVAPNAITTLYVPRGSKSAYEESGLYNQFAKIVEEDVDGTIVYRIKTNITNGYGTITVNGVGVYDKAEVERGKDATITITPAEGWVLQALVCNGYDVTSAVEDGTYTISNLQENITLDITFAEAPVSLILNMGSGGSTAVKVQRNQSFTCVLMPDEGWSVNSVIFDGSDVTADVTDGIYVTPVLYADATLSVSFEKGASGVQDIRTTGGIKANITANGLLTVDGVPAGETVTIVTADGKLCSEWVSSGYSQTIQLTTRGVYVIHTKHKTIKAGF